MIEHEEKLWLVDKNDEPMGEGWQWRSREPGKNWQNFRVINAFIKRSDGRIWIPRRTATKKMFPNCLDVSVGGHVEYGESYEDCFARETREETGLDVHALPHAVLAYLTPSKVEGLSAFMKVWEIQAEEVPNYNPADFSETNWVTPDELREKIASGDLTKGDLPLILNAVYPASS